MALFGLLAAALLGVAACQAETVVVDWDIGYVQVNRDGYNNRRAIGVNGALPIPPITVTHGDRLILNVHNSLTVDTSVHAHGIFFNGTSYRDGAGQVTQCGIPPGESHTYVIDAVQVGTYWIHGHYKHQNADGLRTPFIIREKQPLHQYDDEVLLALEDWYAEESAQKMEQITQPSATTAPPPPSFPFGLINGYNGNDTKPIRFEPGKRYRFRVVSMATSEWFKFHIPGHKLEIIEVDGVDCKPIVVDGLDMGPGQRYSAIVTALDTDEFNYTYNVTLYANFIPLIKGLNPRYYQGLIEYRAGAPVKNLPPVSDRQLEWADDIKMEALDGMPELPVDVTFGLESKVVRTADNRNLRALNEYPYTEPQVPTLFTAFAMGELALDRRVYGPQTEALIVRHMDSVRIRLGNPTDLVHSFHLHGHTFQVVEYGPVDKRTIQVQPNSPLTLETLPDIPVRRSPGAPMRRDTLVIPEFQYVDLRFRADNPGTWMFHCHMDTHFAAGLAVTFVVAPDVLQRTQKLPESLQQMCLRQGLKASGNAVGNQGYDFTGLPPAPVAVPSNATKPLPP
ncbi:ferroxidase fet3 [Coemansia javaensis]|uniref:Ferroxidase fet3 n=1 Tax=Coemansia javaensis TaxID=2761396 RepID=A0A9W8HEX9_9FUNG|nr:ferroxidase fet3 [Coemansia javaensis]